MRHKIQEQFTISGRLSPQTLHKGYGRDWVRAGHRIQHGVRNHLYFISWIRQAIRQTNKPPSEPFKDRLAWRDREATYREFKARSRQLRGL